MCTAVNLHGEGHGVDLREQMTDAESWTCRQFQVQTARKRKTILLHVWIYEDVCISGLQDEVLDSSRSQAKRQDRDMILALTYLSSRLEKRSSSSRELGSKSQKKLEVVRLQILRTFISYIFPSEFILRADFSCTKINPNWAQDSHIFSATI